MSMPGPQCMRHEQPLLPRQAPQEITLPPSPKVMLRDVFWDLPLPDSSKPNLDFVLKRQAEQLQQGLDIFLQNRDALASTLLEQQQYLTGLLEEWTGTSKKPYSEEVHVGEGTLHTDISVGMRSTASIERSDRVIEPSDDEQQLRAELRGSGLHLPDGSLVAGRTEDGGSSSPSSSSNEVQAASDVEKNLADDKENAKHVQYEEEEAAVDDKDEQEEVATDDQDEKSRGYSRQSSRVAARMELHKQVPNLWKSVLRSDSVVSHTSSRDSRDLQNRNPFTNYLRYEVVVMCAVILDAAYIGWYLHRASEKPTTTHEGYIAGAFAVIYIADLVARIWYERWNFLTSQDKYWNICDMLLVIFVVFNAMLVVVGQTPVLGSMSIMLRLVRITRIVNIAKFRNKYIYRLLWEIKTLIQAMQKSCKGFLFMILTCGLLSYCCAVGMTEGALASCGENGLLADTHPACMRFNSLGRASLNLYAASVGGIPWGELENAAEALGTRYQVALTLYFSWMHMVVLNIITGIILQIHQHLNKTNTEEALDVAHERKRCIKRLRDLFGETDMNKSGGISMDELDFALEQKEMIAMIEALKIDIADAKELFVLLDRDHTGAIGIDEFIFGLMRLQGTAKTVDVLKLQIHAEWMTHNVRAIRRSLDEAQGASRSSKYDRRESIDEIFGASPGLQPQSRSSNLWMPTTSKSSIISRLPTTSKSTIISPDWMDKQPTGQLGNIRTKSRFVIERTEERAMTLQDLQEVRRMIFGHCEAESWTDVQTQKALKPEDVTLYHFNHYVICPSTAPEGIELKGLNLRLPVVKGQSVLQMDIATNNCLAEGILQHEVSDGVILVALTKGRFQATEEAKDGHVSIDNVDIGTPSETCAVISLSYKEIVSPRPTKAVWFCSHWWGEPVNDFVQCCQQHAYWRKLDAIQAAYWVCGYANRQHTITDDIDNDPESSAFRRAMKVAEGVLLILDSKATPFRRIWCDFELYHTLADEKPLDIVSIVTEKYGRRDACLLSQHLLPGETVFTKSKREANFPLNLLVAGVYARLENGAASNHSDKEAILNSLLRKMGSTNNLDLAHKLQQANYLLNAYLALAAWPQALRKGCIQDFDPENRGALCLPEVISRATHVHSFNLSLAHIPDVGDADLQTLTSSFPASLRNLDLCFEGCGKITDRGFKTLMDALPEGLLTLSLDFVGCKHISDAGIQALASNLPNDLLQLTLHFDTCPRIGLPGLCMLSDMLPNKIKQFHAGFQGTQVNCKFESLKELTNFVVQRRPKQGLMQRLSTQMA